MKKQGSGWKGESRRHSLARKGVKTNLPDGRRFDVSKFVASGIRDYKVGNYPQDEIKGREKLLGKYYKRYNKDSEYWGGGINKFESVPVDVLQELVKKGYLDINQNQNNSPTTEEFIDYLLSIDKKHKVTAHGYAISKARSDCRVTIEGLKVESPETLKDPDFIVSWYNFNRGADELDKNYSWWD